MGAVKRLDLSVTEKPGVRFAGSHADTLPRLAGLSSIKLTDEEVTFLKNTCPYLSTEYLDFLQDFRFKPKVHLKMDFTPVDPTSPASATQKGDLSITISGLWIDTILYEIPLLALTSEAYFRFCDTDWTYDGQEEKAFQKAERLIKAGCVFSEFGTRRRRSYRTMELVMNGLTRAAKTCAEEGGLEVGMGKLSGTSNVHFAMRYGIPPVGTVAHEWFMGVASITNDYEHANETALKYWVGCFGEGVLGVALTDTFGTKTFLRAFKQKIPDLNDVKTQTDPDSLQGGIDDGSKTSSGKTFAQSFTGVRQDSGDPLEFVEVMKRFYEEEGIERGGKTIVFSDSLDVEKCVKYKEATEAAGFKSSFGVGTFFTSRSFPMLFPLSFRFESFDQLFLFFFIHRRHSHCPICRFRSNCLLLLPDDDSDDPYHRRLLPSHHWHQVPPPQHCHQALLCVGAPGDQDQ